MSETSETYEISETSETYEMILSRYFYFWHTKSDPWDLTMTMTMTMTMTSQTSKTSETSVKTILQTCDNWDTDYNSYNWESEFITIFLTWQLGVTVDSIRNSCDVFSFYLGFWVAFQGGMCNNEVVGVNFVWLKFLSWVEAGDSLL